MKRIPLNGRPANTEAGLRINAIVAAMDEPGDTEPERLRLEEQLKRTGLPPESWFRLMALRAKRKAAEVGRGFAKTPFREE